MDDEENEDARWPAGLINGGCRFCRGPLSAVHRRDGHRGCTGCWDATTGRLAVGRDTGRRRKEKTGPTR